MSTPASNPPETALPTDPPDPITGEPDAHPVGVGVGALSAGAAGAAIGAFGGPVGVVVGAAIGAVAGGLAGHGVASTRGEADDGTVGSERTAPSGQTGSWMDEPLPTASSGLITPTESSFLADSASADSGVTGEAPLVTESALPAAFAVSADADDEPGSAGKATSSEAMSSEEKIRETAFYRYLVRESSGEPGSEFEDWIAAEHDVRGR